MKKKTIAIISVILALTLVLSVLSSGFRDWNAKCWFGHNYGEDGKCARCEQEKPAEKVEQVQSVISEAMSLGNPYDDLSATRAIKAGDVIYNSMYMDYYIDSTLVCAHYDSLETTKVLSLENGKTLYLVCKNEGSMSFFGVYDKPLDINLLTNSSDVPTDLSLTEPDEYYEDFVKLSGRDFGDAGLCGKVKTVYLDGALFIDKYITVLPADPVKEGYTFTGWYTDEACTNKYTAPTVTSDITLYAGFKAHQYSIKFNANGGSGEMANQSMTYDQSKALTANAFTKEHYRFKGWATSANGAVVYSNEQSVKNLTSTQGATIELFAQWERSEVKVDFVSEGNTTTIWVAIGTKATLPETPTKEGYTFVGWFLANGTQYTTQNLSEDTTLTAKFEIIRCSVTFIVDGEVYAVYECDWGTALSDALNANDVNPVLMKVEGEYRRNF